VELNLVAVAKSSWAPSDWNFGQVAELAKPLQLISDKVFFQLKLLRVAQVLVMAAAANREVGARRGDPVGRFLKQLHGSPAGETLLAFIDLNFGCFPRQHKGHKHRPSIRQAPQAIAAIHHLFKFDLLKICHALALQSISP